MRVLVVDDDPDFLHLARKALEARGHDVEARHGAFGLVNRVAGTTGPVPDVVVLDCEMPGLSGFSVIELLAKDRRTAEIPVLLVSADDGDAQRAAQSTHPLARFVRKDGRMMALVDELEAHVASVAATDVVTVKV